MSSRSSHSTHSSRSTRSGSTGSGSTLSSHSSRQRVMKKQKYSVIEERTLEKIIQNVNTRIEEGWVPLGGVAMRYSVWEGNVYVQSLISIEEEDEDYNADDEMDTEETSLQSEDVEGEDDDEVEEVEEEDRNSQENEEVASEADNDAQEAENADPVEEDANVAPVEEDANVTQIEDLTPEVQHQSQVQPPPPVDHTAFCRKYNYVDCNCDYPVINGVRPGRHLTLTDSDDERVSSGIDIQAASYRYN